MKTVIYRLSRINTNTKYVRLVTWSPINHTQAIVNIAINRVRYISLAHVTAVKLVLGKYNGSKATYSSANVTSP